MLSTCGVYRRRTTFLAARRSKTPIKWPAKSTDAGLSEENVLCKNETKFTSRATVCKTVRPVLSVRCLSRLSVTLVYCSQTVERIKMKLDMEVGLGPGDIVLDGDPAPPKRGTAPNFRPTSIVAKQAVGLGHLSYC